MTIEEANELVLDVEERGYGSEEVEISPNNYWVAISRSGLRDDLIQFSSRDGVMSQLEVWDKEQKAGIIEARSDGRAVFLTI